MAKANGKNGGRKNDNGSSSKESWLHIRTDPAFDSKLDSAVKKLRSQGISTSRSGLARALVLKQLGADGAAESAKQIQRISQSVLQKAVKDMLGQVPHLVEQELSG